MTRPTMVEVPPRLDGDDECVGCGNEKHYRGRSASSLICCGDCFKRIPKWLVATWHLEGDKTGGDPMKWQGRIALFLRWMNESANGERETRDED